MQATTDRNRPRYRRGAGVVLFNAQAQVWVGQRIDNPGPAWQMPQGGLDPGEDPSTRPGASWKKKPA